ncbi:MAG: DUF4175 family protein [Gemmatimonadota bacterium]
MRSSAPPGPLAASSWEVVGWLRRQAAWSMVRWWITAGLALICVAWLLAGSTRWDSPSAAPALLLAVFTLGVGWASFRGFQWTRRYLRLATVLRSMEDGAGLPRGALQGALELESNVPPGVSPALASAAGRRVLPHLHAVPLHRAGILAGEVKRLGPHPAWPMALLVLTGVLGVLAPARTGLALQGLMSPWTLLAGSDRPPLTMSPMEARVVRGAGLPVEVTARGRHQVTLFWQRPGELPDSLVLGVEDNGSVQAALPPVEAVTTFWAHAPDGATTHRGEVRPTDPLLLAGLEVQLFHPSHTGLPSTRMTWPVPPLDVPEGTRLVVGGMASRVLSQASMELPSQAGTLEMEVDGVSFQGEVQVRQSGSYALRLTDEGGLRMEPSPVLDVEVIPDLPPTLQLLEGPPEGVVPVDLRARFRVEARDDYGLTELQVEYLPSLPGQETSVRTFPLAGIDEALLRPILDLSGLHGPGTTSPPGSTVRIRMMAVDNAPARQRSAPIEVVLRFPQGGEVDRTVQEELDALAGGIQALGVEAAERAREGQELAQAGEAQGGTSASGGGSQDPTSSFQDREALRQASQAMEGMLDQANQLMQQLEAMQAALEENPASNRELARDLADLRALLEEVGGAEARALVQELARALDDETSTGAMEAMEAMSRQQEAIRDQLEASLQRALRAAAEAEWRDAIRDANRAAEAQEELARELSEGDPASEDLTQAGRRQEAEALAAEAMIQRMERLAQRLERLEEWEAATQARQVGEQVGEAQKAMEQAGDAARSGDSPEAAAQSREASQRMEAVAQELTQARDDALEQWMDDLLSSLDAVAVESLALAREQALIRDDASGAAAPLRAQLRARQGAVLQGTRNLATALSAAARTAPGAVRPVSAAVGRALQAGVVSLERLESAGSASGAGALVAARESQESLNQVAQLALEARQRMSEAGASGASALEQLLQELEDVAQQQGELLADAAALMNQEPGAGEAGDQVHPLAMGQEAVAGELGGLADHPAASELPLGDLEALTQEAEALARELAQEGSRISPQLVQRQERLFQRLLDAGRSLRQDDQSDQREATAASEWELDAVPPLAAELLRAFRFAPPSAAELDGLPLHQRNWILLYFQRLNR